MRNSRSTLARWVLFLAGLGLPVSGLAYGGPITISDNFNDNALNASLWATVIEGDGSVSEVGQRLVTTVLATPAPRSQATAFAVLLGTIGGNFDISVHYELLAPLPLTHGDTGGGIVLGAVANEFSYVAARDVRTLWSSSGWVYDNAYVGAVGNGEDKIPTADSSGALRLTRVGSSYSAYYWGLSGGLWDWRLISSGTGSTDPMSFLALGVFIAGPEAVSFAFDDFTLVADEFTAVPEPASLLLLGTGLAGVVRAVRKRRG